ncbi:unnamed protein product, partial [Pylaiella littoralis]
MSCSSDHRRSRSSRGPTRLVACEILGGRRLVFGGLGPHVLEKLHHVIFTRFSRFEVILRLRPPAPTKPRVCTTQGMNGENFSEQRQILFTVHVQRVRLELPMFLGEQVFDPLS